MSNTQGGLPPQEGVTDSTNSKERDQTEDDDTTHSPEYNDKFKIVLSYKPFLETMIQRLEKATDKSREAQLIKMQSLYNILFNPTKQLKLGTILRCEKVLKSLYEKIEKSTLLPEEIKAVKEQVGSAVNALQDQTLPETNLQKSPINNSVDTKKEEAITKTLSSNTNLNKEHKTINLNDSSKADYIKSPSKVNEESRRKLCNIIMKQRQEESPTKAVTNTNEQTVPVCKVSTPLPSPSNEKQIIEEKSSEIFNKHPNVLNSNKETTLKKQIDIKSNKDKSVYDNILSHGDRMPFSSTATDDYSFESLDRDDSKRYLAWNEPNVIQSDQSLQREIIDLNMANQKLPCLPAQQNLNIPKQKLPCLSMSVHQNIPNLSPNISKSDKIDKNILGSHVQQENRYINLAQQAGTEMFSGSQHAAPSEKECANLNLFKSNINSEPSKLLSPESRPQSLREKLTEQISAVHKVGTSCGGALRGLVNREDKIITPTRMANLKAGTILDLIGQDKPHTSRISHVKAKPNLGKLHDEMPKFQNIQINPNLGKLQSDIPTLHNIQVKPILGKLHDEMSKLHSIPHPPQDHPSTVANNDITNSIGLTNLGFDNNSTLDALTKMNPKELERLVHDHILKLPGSSETIHCNLDKEKDFLNKKPNAEIDRGTLNRNCNNPNIRPLLQHTSDPRKGFHNVRTASNIPRYEAHVQRLPNSNQSEFSPFSQSVGGNIGNPLYNSQAPASNMAQSNQKFVYGAATHDNRSQTYNANIETNDYLHTGVYKKPELKVPENIGGRNPNTYVNYNNAPSELNTYSHSLNANANHYQQTTFNQSDQFKWTRRPSTSTDSNTGYNPLNRHSVIPTNANKNFNTSREDRTLNSEKHNSRSLTSQKPISIRDPRRKSVEETFNRSNSNRTEQSRNTKNFDPRLSRNPKRNSNDYVSNRDPRVRDSFSSSPHRQKSLHQKKSVENDFKTKGTFSSPLDKLYSTTTNSKTGKGYGPQKFKIPKLKSASSQKSDSLSKNQTSATNTSKNIKVRDINMKVDEHNEDNHFKCIKNETDKSIKNETDKSIKNETDKSIKNETDKSIKNETDKSIKNETEERSNKNSAPNHSIDKDGMKSDDSDEEIRPPRNSRHKRSRWDQTERDVDFNSKTSDDKKVVSKQGKKSEVVYKSKDKVEKEPKSRSVQKRKNEILSKPKDTVDSKQEIETEDQACSSNTTVNTVNEFRDKAISDSKDSEKEISSSVNSEKEILSSVNSEKEISSSVNSEGNPSSETKFKNEDLQNIFPSSLFDLLASEEKMKFFSKLGENLNAEKLKKIKRIIESNSDDEEDSTKTIPPPVTNEIPGPNTIEEDKKLISSSSDQQLEDCRKSNEKSPSYQTKPFESDTKEEDKITENNQSVKNKQENVVQDLDSKNSNILIKSPTTNNAVFEESHQENSCLGNNDPTNKCEIGLGESNKSLDAIENETLLSEKDLQQKKKSSPKKKYSKKGTNKKTIQKKTSNYSALDSIEKIIETTMKPKKKQKNELEKLQEDIRDMFISQGVVSATGMRLCRLKKTMDSAEGNDISNKEPVGSVFHGNKSGRKSLKDKKTIMSEESDSSEEDTCEKSNKKKTPVRRTSTKSSVSKKPIMSEESDSSEEDTCEKSDKKKTPVRRTSTKSSVSKKPIISEESDSSEEDTCEKSDKKKTPVRRTSTKSSVSKKPIISEESDSSEEDTCEKSDKKKTPVRRTSTKSSVSKKPIMSEESDSSEEDTCEKSDKKKTPVRRTSTKSSVSKKTIMSEESDSSEEDTCEKSDKKKTPVRRTSTKSSVSCKKSDKDSVSATNSDGSEDYIEETIDKKKSSVGRTSTKSSVSCKKSDKDSVSATNSDGSEDDIGETRDKKKTPVDRTSNKSSVSCNKNDKTVSSISVEEKIDSDYKEKSMKVGTDVSRCEAICSPRVVIRKSDFAKFEKKTSECVSVETQLEQTVDEENTTEKESSEAVIKAQSSSVDSANLSSMVNNSINIDQGLIEKCLKAQQVLQKYDLKRKNRKKPKWQLGVLEKKRPRKKVEAIKDDCQEQKLKININDINYYQENENVMHECKICSYEGKMIVRHYTTNHPGEEVMISRISPDSAKQATEESKNKQFNLVEDNLVDTKCKNKVFNCRMCSRTFTNAVIFFDHITFHTGEYRYECHICKYRISSKSGLKSHLLASHNEGKKLGIELKATVYDDPPYSSIVLGFLCSECNFVQLISENMNKHLSSKHGENTSGQLPKAITINLSKPFVSNQENLNINSICGTKNKIDVISDNQIQTNEIDDGTDQFSDIKIEQPGDLTIIDVENMDTDENDGFEEDSTAKLENVIEPSSEDDLGTYLDQEEASNLQKKVALNVFLGYDDNDIKDSELNVERERIMNDIVTKLKTQTKPQKGSVLDQIKSKLTMSIIEHDSTPQISKKKDVSNENDSSRHKSAAKEKLVVMEDCFPEDSDVPVRRTLPERSCKDKGQGLYADENVFTNIEEDSDSSASGIELELQKYVEELRMSGSEHSEMDEDICFDLIKVVEMKPTAESPIKNKPMASTITRLQDTLNRPDTVFNIIESDIQLIDDSVDQFTISDFTLLSEETWPYCVAKMDVLIVRFACGSVCEDVLPLKVGSLEVTNSNGCVTFHCHNCAFISTSILTFGEHIKTHQFQFWDGKCTHCKTIYRKENEEKSCYSILTTFCHLLESHLFKESTNTDVIQTSISTGLMRNVPPPPPVIPLAEYYESQNKLIQPPKTPLLRVRRLSGDKLSSPAAENSLATNNLQVQDIPANAFQGAAASDQNCYEAMQESCIQQTAEDEPCTFLRIESVVSLRPESADDFNPSVMDGDINVSLDETTALPCDRPRSYISLIPETSSSLDSNPRFDYQTPNLNIQESNPTKTTEVPTNSQLVSIPTATVTKNSPNVSTAASKSPPTKLPGRGKSKDSRKSVLDYKTNKVYAQMLVHSKLRHFYKCMGRVCSFTCESMEKFAVHYEQHRSFQVEQDSEKAWRVCPYCFDTFECARDYCIHMKKEHGYSNMQCPYCFYRAATLGNVLYHQNTCHITAKMMVLECASQGLGDPPPRLVKFDNFIKPFVCGQVKCNFYTFIPETFRQHLHKVHNRLNNLRCHLCVGFTARLDRLIEHYRVHAIAMYQCLYCIHGETIEDLMREHLCYSHSNQQPSAVKRIDITKHNPSPSKHNLERLKRINFKELEEQTHTLIHYSPEENELPSTSSTSEPLNLPSTSNKVISSDDDIQIIQTINKSNLISEVICLESSDEDECMVINEQTPVISKKRTRPTEISDNSTNLSQGDTDNFDTPPCTKRSKEDFNKDTFLNVQPSTSRSDVTNIQDNSSDSNSNTMIENPKFGLTGSALFRCGNKGCDYGAKNSLILKDHMIKCELFGPAMTCVHCNKVFKYASSLIEHIRVHGTLRYRCSLCDFKGPVAVRVSSHMKNVHKISNTKVEPMNPREKDDDTDEFVCIPKVTGKGGKSNKKKSSSKSKAPAKFSLTDIDKIPYRSIFSTPLGCSSCTYETKVRSNLVQHLTLHAAGHSVPQEEMVNPVPCLEKKEKMFDKMMNLANSSHKNSDKFLSHEMEVYFPMYIPTNQRYVCHAKGCTYVTIDDTMLRYHIRTLHNEETTYRCPHCPSDDPASQTPIDKLSTHLKMHDTKLYACSSCNYYHFSRYVCEKHVHDRHPGLLACVRVIRETGTLLSNTTTVEDEPKDEGGRTKSLLTPPSGSAIQNTPEKKNWHCNLCKFRSEEQMPMRKHCNKSHGMIHQYKCRLCKYESDIFSDFDDHFAKLHPNLPITVITSFNQIAETPSTSTAVTSGSDNAQGVKAYWRRNTISVKHIRGILLDDEPAVVSSPPVISEPVAIKEDPNPESVIPLPHPKYGPYGEPSPENQFKCPMCNHTYRNKSEFKIHLCKELDYTPWVCTRCSKCYINKSSITKHARIVHDCDDSGIGSIIVHHPNQDQEQWVETMIAVQKSLMKKKETDQNRKNVPKKRKASVDTNNQKKIVPEAKKNQPKTNSQKISKEDHSETIKKKKKVEGKQNSSERKRNFMCGYCSTATVLRRSVRAHQLKKHPGLPSLILCSDGTPAVVRRRTINSNVPLNISEKVEKASEGVSEVEIKNSEDNEAEYGDIPYYTCFYCKWSSKTISAIKDHWKFLHKDAVLLSDGKCKDNTGVNFLYKKSKTSSEQEYACKWCKKQGTVSVLKEHSIKEHVGLKFGVSQVFKTKYKCSKCNIIVNSVEVLKRHISSEHQKMPDENKSDRKIIPTNKKDDAKCYKCPKCNYSSPIFKNAVKHLIKHGTSFKCGVCENVYRSLHGVRSHMGIKHPGSSVNAKVIPPSNIDIAAIKKQIIVVKKICNTEIECTKFNKLQIKHVKATKTIVPPLGRYFSDTGSASNSKPKGSPSSVLSCKEKVLNTNPINQLKLDPSGNSKNLLKPKYFNIKNRTEGDKKTKSLTLKKTGFKTNESVTFTSNDKLVKLGLRNFTRLFNVRPKIHIEPLIVHP